MYLGGTVCSYSKNEWGESSKKDIAEKIDWVKAAWWSR